MTARRQGGVGLLCWPEHAGARNFAERKREGKMETGFSLR